MFLKLLLPLLLLSWMVTAEAKVRSIALSYLSAEEAIQLIRPILGPNDTVSVVRGSVYVDSGRSAFNKVAALLGEVDIAPTLYLLSVREVGAQVAVGLPDVTTDARRTTVESVGHQQIHASTGRPVFVEVGNGISALGFEQSSWRRGSSVQTELGKKGFHVLFNVKGDVVTLSASDIQVSDRYNSADEFESSNLIYSTEGVFGQWMPLVKTHNIDKRLAVKNRRTAMSPVSRYQIRVSKITR